MSDLLKPLIKEASVKSLKEGNKEITMVLRLILAEFQKNLLASTHPADPAPRIIKSKLSIN